MAAEIKLNFDVTGLGQHTSTTCWLACYHMLYAWKGADRSQIKPKIEKSGFKWNELVSRGLYPEEFVKAGHYLGMMGLFVPSVRDWSYEDLRDRLKQYGPLWCAVDLVDDGDAVPTHAICVYGMHEGRDHVLIYDPYKKPYDGDPEIEYWTLKRWKSKLVATSFDIQVWA